MTEWSIIRADIHLGQSYQISWYFIRRAGTKELVFDNWWSKETALDICAAHNEEIGND